MGAPDVSAATIRAALEHTGVSQADLARRLGVDKATVWRWCSANGRARQPGCSKLQWVAIRAALKLPARWVPARQEGEA